MCDVSDDQDNILREPFKHMCYHTGKTIYDIKTDFNDTADDHAEAYMELNRNMKRYLNQWETLGDDFYQYVNHVLLLQFFY